MSTCTRPYNAASILHLAGNYPGANFEEQWRAEGVVRPVPLSDLSKVAPLDADLEVGSRCKLTVYV